MNSKQAAVVRKAAVKAVAALDDLGVVHELEIVTKRKMVLIESITTLAQLCGLELNPPKEINATGDIAIVGKLDYHGNPSCYGPDFAAMMSMVPRVRGFQGLEKSECDPKTRWSWVTAQDLERLIRLVSTGCGIRFGTEKAS